MDTRSLRRCRERGLTQSRQASDGPFEELAPPLSVQQARSALPFVTKHFIHSHEWTLPEFDPHRFTFEFSPVTPAPRKGRHAIGERPPVFQTPPPSFAAARRLLPPAQDGSADSSRPGTDAPVFAQS